MPRTRQAAVLPETTELHPQGRDLRYHSRHLPVLAPAGLHHAVLHEILKCSVHFSYTSVYTRFISVLTSMYLVYVDTYHSGILYSTEGYIALSSRYILLN